jgi:ATP-binding cassette subfamily C protein
VIGKSGSGKTTFLNVLSGLLRPSVGSVKVNGKNILYRENMWHTHISYVSQEIFLMDDSILSNIAFGINNENIDNKKINEIIELCELGPLIKSLPNGLQSNIGYNGAKLSGGQ